MKTIQKKIIKRFLSIALLFFFQSRSFSQTGSSLNFDGFDDYVVCPSYTFGNNWTVEAWIYPRNVGGGWYSICGQDYWNVGQGFAMAIQSGTLFVETAQGTHIETSITVNTWAHVAVTYNNGILALYKNGILADLKIASYAPATGETFIIGGRHNNNSVGLVNSFNGEIDEVRVWNSTRSQCEIQQYMNCEIPTSATGLLANYHFNQGIASLLNTTWTLTDNSGNNNHGTLQATYVLLIPVTGFLLQVGSSSNWVANTAVTSGFSTPASPSTSEINLLGNGNSILDGSITTSTTNHTDFNGTFTRTFVIQNTGSQTLNVGSPVLTGSGANQFSITALPSNILAASTGSTSFVVAFTPTSLGAKTATLTIYNNDCNEENYDFVITATAVTGSALNFDGVNDYVSLPFSPSSWNLGSSFTLEMWLKPNSTAVQEILYAGLGCVVCPEWALSIGPESTCSGFGNAGRIQFMTNLGGFVQSDAVPTLSVWTHVAVTYNGSIMKMFVNGVQQTLTAAITGTMNSPSYGYIGADPGCGLRYPYNGSLDEFRIWNKALCQTEIVNNMNCEIPTTAAGLTANYHFNQGIGNGLNTTITSLTDVSGTNLTGTLVNFALNGGANSNWVGSSTVTTGNSCTLLATPDIQILGNSNFIPVGYATPSSTNNTQFGNVGLGSTTSQSFVIQNTGTSALNISSYTLSGVGASHYSVTTAPSALVPISGSTSIVLTFSPTSLGLKSATLSIISDDCDESPYLFAIEGTAVSPGAALNFDGTNDQASGPIISSAINNISMQAKVFWGGNNGFNQMVMYNGNSSTKGYGIYVGASGNVSILFGGVNFYPCNYTLTPGIWTSLTSVIKYDSAGFYVNGLATANFSIVAPNTPTGGCNVGSNYAGNEVFNGSIDEVRFWDKALTQCEIQTYLDCEIPGSAPNLLANYHFNQGLTGLSNPTTTLVIDASGNSNNLSLSNFSLTGLGSNWVSPGGVVSGYTTTTPPIAEIDVRGNGNSIIDGNTGTSAIDFTDFNGVNTRTFTIHNTIGGGTLNIGNLFLTGVDANQFAITTLPSSSVVGIGSTSFVVVFTPTSTGVKSATININNNDCSEPLYDFVITATAVAGGALTFDGINDKIDVTGILDPQSTNYSLECWFKINSDATRPTLFKHAAATGTGRSHLFVSNTLHTLGTITGGITLTGTTTITPGIWYHAAYTWNGTTRKLYLNGILEAYDNSSLEPSTGSDWTFGMNASSNFLDGSMDEVRIWNTERSQCEIQTYKDCEIPTTASGLLANYHFNQGIAGGNNPGINILSDAAGSNTASVINFSLSGLSSNWTNPGGVISGYTTTSAPTATLTVYGNGNTVPIGVTTSTTNYTDFDLATNRTFLVHNLGVSPLYVNAITFSGANASNFSVTSLPSASISGSSNSPFIISFTPTAVGSQSAIVNISSNDCTNPTFSFVITASTTPASALAFDGASDYIQFADPNLGASDFTLEQWIKPNVPQNSYLLTTRTNEGSQAGNWFVISLGINGNVGLELGGSPGIMPFTTHTYVSTTTPSNVINVGSWNHIAAVRAGNSIKLYVNGLLQANVTAPTTNTLTTGNNILRFGGAVNPNNQWYNGSLDEIRIWNTARSQCQIQTFMNCEIPATAPGLLANYHFNQGIPSGSNTAVTMLTDAAGANTGTLTGFTLTGSVSNWVSPSSIVNGFSTSVAPTATIAVSGNGNNVPQSTATFGSNNTDFGTNAARTFSIYNAGTGTLNINSITFTGPNAAQFSVTTLPLTSVTTGTTGFVITLTPTNTGVNTATVNISSNDCSNPTFSFVITATAVVGAALNFDGTDDFIDCGTSSNLDITIGTWEAWVNLSTLATNSRIFFKENADGVGNGTYESYFLAANGKFQADIKIGATNYSVTSVTSPLTNTWYHVAVTFDGLSLKMYVNGILEVTNALTIGAMNPGTGHLSLGASYAAPLSSGLTGTMDEARLWNRALCQNEIQAQMNCELSGSEPGLILYYKLNAGIANGVNTGITSVTDVAGGDNTGTLSSFSLSGLSSNWVAPGAVLSGSSCAAFTAPEINLVSNATSILDGDNTSSITDNTDFGNISANNTIVKTYTIQNTGASNLAVTSITMSGADANSFIVGALSPASPVAGGSSAVFSITFAPSSAGTKSAVVNITNNDCDEAIYDFVVTGTSTVGAAFTFDGTDDYINCGNILTASYTKEAWVKINASTNGNNLLSSGSGTIGTALWAPGIYGYKLSAGHNNTWAAVQDPAALSFSTWYHVAVTYDAASLTMVLYKNGAVVASTNNVQPFSGTDPISIGAFSGLFVTNGSMDEVRIWNRPLCQAEIQNNMNCEIPTTASGLIANYHFNQGVANGSNTAITSLMDASGSANNGTLTNIAATGTISNWVAVGGVTSGSSCAAYFTPEINLVGNAQSINDGDMTPSSADHTDFGGVCVNGQIVRTFTIQNTGTANLSVSSITVGGGNASLSNIGPLTPASPIAPGNSAVFSVSFSPTSAGVKTTTLYITNSDCNEGVYDFAMTGTCNALPTVTASATNSVICEGASTTLNGLGADTYTWTGGVVNGVSFTPSVTLSYSVSGTNTLTGCTSTNNASQTITVNINPTVTANAVNTVICDGATTTLTASGAANYTWNPGAISNLSISPSPSLTTTYIVAATSTANCASVNTVVITVSVNALPTVTALTSNSVVCLNFTTSLNGAGADTYTWTGGVTNGVAFTPGSTQTYSVTGTNTLSGCVSTNVAVQTITVDALPTVSISTSNSVICEGSSATLTATGANTYTWNPGTLTGTIITPSPVLFTTYTLSGTSLGGCTNTNIAVQSISVNTLPTVSANISSSVICAGNTITLSGSGAATYTWTDGAPDGIAFSPTATSTYTLSGTNSAGCTNTNLAVASVTVNALPQLSVTVSNAVICLGDQTTLNGSGAATYTWSGGITNNQAFSPTVSTTYTLTGTDNNTCENSTVTSITVNALPQLIVSSSNSIACEAQSATLTVSGATSYSWNTGETTADIVITPTATSIFTINATDANNCSNFIVYTQSVAPCPGTFSAWAAQGNVSCAGKNDGYIAVKYSSSYPNAQVSYVWAKPGLCSNVACDSIGGLDAGTYAVTVKFTYTLNSILVKTDSVTLGSITILDENGQCEVTIFSGITANNDGINDVLTVENIEQFPNNRVSVYNRWGQLVFEKKGYNNVDVAWPVGDDGSKLISNTYFYVIDLGNGSKPLKGWIELIKN